MRARPPPSAQGSLRRARRARPERAQRVPTSSEGVESRSPRPPARERSSTPAARAWDRARQVTLGLVEAPDQQEAPRFERSRVRGVDPVAVCFERRPRRVERLRGPAQIARDERNLCLGDNAPRAGHDLFRTEGTRSPAQEHLRSSEIAELRHRDASKCERRCIVAQRNPLQGAEGITRGEGMRRGRDQRVHRNPATLVTPTVSVPDAKSIS